MASSVNKGLFLGSVKGVYGHLKNGDIIEWGASIHHGLKQRTKVSNGATFVIELDESYTDQKTKNKVSLISRFPVLVTHTGFAENILNHWIDGDIVHIEGKITTKKFTDDGATTDYVTIIETHAGIKHIYRSNNG